VGLEAALAEVVERNLEHSGAVIGRLNLEEHGHIHREIVAGALLRLAEATSQGPVSRALQQVLDRKEKAVVEDVIFLALAEGHSSARPRGAAVLAEAALEQSLGTRSGSLLRIARALRRAGKAELAERALRVVPGDCTAASEAKRGYLLGSLLRDHGRWEEGLALLRLAKAEFRALGDPDGLLAARASIAETLSLLERFDEAAADLDEAEREMAGAGTETELLFRIKHAQSLRMRGLLRKAYVRCEDVLRRATSAALAPLAARAQTEMGIIHALLDDPAGGIRFLESAIATKRQLGDSRGLKQAYLCLGFAQAKGQNMPAACAAYEQSLALNQETNDYYGELLCLEFLTRLDPSLAKEAQIAQAVARAHTVESWKNPRIKTIVERFKRELNPSGGT
jgi:tetratricopeptide (TPR) repeat protein